MDTPIPQTLPRLIGDGAPVAGEAPDLLNTLEAAELLKVSVSFLRKDRRLDNPYVPFVRLGAKIVRYRLSDLMQLVSPQTATVTREANRG